jgi:hypothetical protein
MSASLLAPSLGTVTPYFFPAVQAPANTACQNGTLVFFTITGMVMGAAANEYDDIATVATVAKQVMSAFMFVSNVNMFCVAGTACCQASMLTRIFSFALPGASKASNPFSFTSDA